jgi:hypothetical protein
VPGGEKVQGPSAWARYHLPDDPVGIVMGGVPPLPMLGDGETERRNAPRCGDVAFFGVSLDPFI